MIKMWGRNTSSNVQKAMWAVGELGLECTRIDVGGAFGKTKEAPYLAMNPNALVPTLEEEDGFILWESNSITRYLASKHDKAGVIEPKDLKQRGLAHQWMDWQLSVVGPAITPLFWGLIRTPADKRDLKAIEASRVKSGQMAAILDAAVADRMYVAGPFTMGEIPIGCEVQRWMRLPMERPRLPHLEAWYERLSARQAFKKHVDLPLT